MGAASTFPPYLKVGWFEKTLFHFHEELKDVTKTSYSSVFLFLSWS